MGRNNNQLPENIPQLQNLIKRDPESYYEEFQQQYQHFQNTVEVFHLNPEELNRTLEELVTFMAQIASCYPEDLSTLPQQLIDLLQRHNTVLNSSMRMTFCKGLILLRNKNLLAPTDLLELFYQLLNSQDKILRDFLRNHIINDVKNVHNSCRDTKLKSSLQTCIFSKLKTNNQKAAKMSIDIIIELYRKQIWTDAKTVNVIATSCFSKFIKIAVASIKFFLSKDEEKPDSNDSDSDSDAVDLREVAMANKVHKKTRKRTKRLSKMRKIAARQYKTRSQAPKFNFSAIHLIHDPQTMAERLFKQLNEQITKRFEVKLITLDLISRLIGLHNLFVLNYYPYVQRLLQPHQREVVRLLQFTAQACHELVPPDIVHTVLKTIANNFITERNTSDVMAIGLNAVKEICARCPLGIEEDLLRDLSEYKTYKNKSVMMAARGLIHLFRTVRPGLLHKKDRGRPTQFSQNIEAIEYGQINAKDYVVGAEVLAADGPQEFDISSDDNDDDEGWINVEQDEEEKTTEVTNTNNTSVAQRITVERLLTDDDFKRIDAANIRRQVDGAKTSLKKRPAPTDSQSEFVRLSDIENIYKKRRHDKMSRLESVESGRKDREKFGYKDGRLNPMCSKTNREKKKTKNFQMMRHKVRGRTKAKSFKEKQLALRNHLLKLKKMK